MCKCVQQIPQLEPLNVPEKHYKYPQLLMLWKALVARLLYQLDPSVTVHAMEHV